jgi:hypothetical protein
LDKAKYYRCVVRVQGIEAIKRVRLTQSIESLTKKVDGQQKSASREIPQDVRVAMEGVALQGVADKN